MQRLASLQQYPRKHFDLHEKNNSTKCSAGEEQNNLSNNSNTEHNNIYTNLSKDNVIQNSETHIPWNLLDKSEVINELYRWYNSSSDEEHLKTNHSVKCGEFNLNMGSNVSRHSGKGLSGRRTQSSGMYSFTINNFDCPMLFDFEIYFCFPFFFFL